jgi:ribonuclease J
LYVEVHRGANQIGGSIIEVGTAKTRILFDAGSELDSFDGAPLPEVDGLFDRAGFDAVFFSHNHLDHVGLAQSIHPGIPLYMGERAIAVMEAMARYLGKPLGFGVRPYQRREQVVVGDIKVTPFIIDHSAFDAYMLLAESDGESVLYTGDFRSSGRKPFDRELARLPAHVGTLICEGTNMGGKNKPSVSESELEEQATRLFRQHSGPVFVLQASTNIDRIVTMYRAAKRSGRVFIQDLYMAEIARAAAPTIPNPDFDDVRVYLDRYYSEDHHRYQAFDEYGAQKIGRAKIANQKFVLCVRALMAKMLMNLSERTEFSDGLLVYSMWNGYRDKPEVVRFLQLARSLGLTEVYLHNSGHADKETIDRLIEHVNPDKVIAVHTENPSWVNAYRKG